MKFPATSSFPISRGLRCTILSRKNSATCRCSTTAAASRMNFRSPNFTGTSMHFAFIPGYKQHNFRSKTRSTSKPSRSWARSTTRSKPAATRATTSNAFSSASCSACSPRTPAFLSANRSGSTSKTAPRRTARIWAANLARLFEVLNTAPEKRQKNLDETLAAFPYVNGDLFNEHLGFADFNRDMRNALLACTRKDWSRISPAIFGSLFQSIMETRKRRQIGAHYTSERDILKVIRSLFLDELRAEFESRKADRSTGRRARLEEFHDKLCQSAFSRPGLRLRQFPRHRLPRTAPA